MRLMWHGVVKSLHRQPGEYPTLVNVWFPDLPNMQFQSPHDCEDVTGQCVTLTLDVDMSGKSAPTEEEVS